MYTSFFGLNDIPFSIAPNPDFLFLSDRHREALTHLTYGLGDTGGFVLLTGEVGTGKTTISRKLLEQLPENTQVAFILNPTLSCLELLATICDELKVRYKKTGITLKYLTDKIQEKLLKNQENNINTLLIIDEAQHLQAEVLEQLRLLTNLETNTKKLLQVILIGQPELQQLLQRRDLRQLAQRITARYHLLPLTPSELEQYIKHRLSVVDCHRALFNKAALKTIHKISQGIPRLVNLLCERALANAYGNNDSVVTKKIILLAAQQALGSEFQLTPWWKKSWLLASVAAASLSLVALGGFWLGSFNVGTKTPNLVQSGVTHSEPKTEQAEEKSPSSAPVEQILETPVVAKPEQAGQQTIESVNTEPKNTESTESSPEITSPSKAQSEPVESIQTAETNSELTTEQPKFELSSVEGVSPELLEKFQSAIEETSDSTNEQQIASNNQAEHENIRPLTDMPLSVQNAIPALQFEMHIYASDGNGWVKVNGRDRYEGDVIATDVFLDKILPQQVILSYRGEQFSLPALSSW